MTTERRDWRGIASGILRPPSPAFAKVFGVCAIVISVAVGIVLFTRHTTLSGPGDQLSYYFQAGRLRPFTDHYYGPGYFVAIRVVHDLLNTDWLTAGKTVSFVSTIGVLVACAFLFRAVLGTTLGWLALGLLALTPDLIGQMYTDLTIPFGAVWLLAAIATTVGASVDNRRRWIAAALLFGLASLVRFQSFGFFLGAVLGIAFLPGMWRARIQTAALVLIVGILPSIAWKVFLVLTQGSAPANWNFIALTMGSGEFQEFTDVGSLVDKYGSFLGLIRADPLLIPKLVVHAGMETIRFPLGVGAQMLGPAVLWIGPGLIAGLFDRRFWSPWAMAITVGFLITLPTQPGWTHYFVPMLPLLIILLIWGVELPDRSTRPAMVAVGWFALIGATLLWSAHKVPMTFDANDWAEQSVAKEYLNRGDARSRVVSSTAATISYGGRFRFVDFDRIRRGRDGLDVVADLREAGVTHLVVTARHSLFQYPAQAVLLADSLSMVPDGLVRDTLIVYPQRLAIFRVLP